MRHLVTPLPGVAWGFILERGVHRAHGGLPMSNVVELHRKALDEFGGASAAVPATAWHQPTPCPDWDVAELVNHVVGENRWAVPLLAGSDDRRRGRPPRRRPSRRCAAATCGTRVGSRSGPRRRRRVTRLDRASVVRRRSRRGVPVAVDRRRAGAQLGSRPGDRSGRGPRRIPGGVDGEVGSTSAKTSTVRPARSDRRLPPRRQPDEQAASAAADATRLPTRRWR